MNNTDKPDLHRRDFLRGSVMASASVSLAAAAPGLVQAAEAPETPAVTPEPAKRKGYQLTPHISAYYKSAAL